MADDPQQPLAQAQLRHHTTTHQPAQPMLSLQDLDQFQQWSRIAQSYPYPSSLEGMDGTATQAAAVDQHRHHRSYTDPIQAAEIQQHQQEETNRRLQQEAHTTHHFPGTHPALRQRQSPTTTGTATSRGSPTHVNDLTRDLTTMIPPHGNVDDPMQLAVQLAAVGGVQVPVGVGSTTNTGASLGHSLDGSQSWNSAMTPMQIQQLDQLYRFQQQHQQTSHAQRLRQDSSRPLHNSSSPIAPHHPHNNNHPHPPPSSSPAGSSTSSTNGLPPHTTTGQAHHYSQELRRQQQEQMRRQQEQMFLEQQRPGDPPLHREGDQQQRERQQSMSTDEEYLRHIALAEAFHRQQQHQQRTTSSPLGHPGHSHHYFPQQQQQQEGVYMDAGEYHQQAQGMLDHQEAYHLVDLVGVQEGSPNGGMIKYDSPLPLE